MTPSERRGKAGEVRIRGYPFAPIFDGDCGVDRVSDNFALQAAVFTKTPENVPVLGSRANQTTRRPFEQSIDEAQRLGGGGRGIEDTRVRRHP